MMSWLFLSWNLSFSRIDYGTWHVGVVFLCNIQSQGHDWAHNEVQPTTGHVVNQTDADNANASG